MKGRITAALLALCLTAGVSLLPAEAAYQPAESSVGRIVEKDKYTYRINSDGTVSMLGFTEKAIETGGVVTVPATLSGRQVTELADSTAEFFRVYSGKIKYVDIPASVTEMSFCWIGFKDIPADYTCYKRATGMKIRCPYGSEAEKYAIRYGVGYEYNDGTDKLTGVLLKDSRAMGTMAFKFKWNEVKGAAGYRVLRSEDGKNFKQCKVLSGKDSTLFKDTGLKQGISYSYKVQAYRKVSGKKEYGKGSSVVTALTKPPAPKLKAAAKKVSGSLEVKVISAAGYKYNDIQIYDTNTKTWCSTGECEVTAANGSRVRYCIKSYIMVNPFTGREFEQKIESGKKYKVRAFALGSISDTFGFRMVKGAKSATLSVKAK